MKELIDELRACMRAADTCYAIHKEIKKQAKWSRTYLVDIKNGKHIPKDSLENREELRRLITLYETALHKHVKNIETVL